MAETGPTRRDVHSTPYHHEKDGMEESERKGSSSADVENNEFETGDHYGDNSDGKIDWTPKQVVAVLSLSALWVGMSPVKSSLIVGFL